MPHWLAVLLLIAGSTITLATFTRLAWQHVGKPIADGTREALDIFRRLLTAAQAVQRFAADIHGLSGAFTLFAVEIKRQVDENTERLERLEDMRELVVDLDAAVLRITRHLGISDESDDRKRKR